MPLEDFSLAAILPAESTPEANFFSDPPEAAREALYSAKAPVESRYNESQRLG